jgi:hypothetical protein
MSGNRKPKFYYKIFDTRTGKYYSNNSKATWTSRSWVSYHLPKTMQQHYEVHIFPVSEPVIQSAKDFLETEAIAEMDRKLKRLSQEEKQRKEREHQQHLEDLRKLKELQEKVNRYQSFNSNC